MKRLRLIPESELNNLTIKKSDLDKDSLNEQKKQVLDLNDIPSSVKNLIYQDLARRLKLKQQQEKSKPVLVKNIENKETTPKNQVNNTLEEQKLVNTRLISEPYILQQLE